MRSGLAHRVRDRIECLRVRRLVQPFLDGELDRAARRRVHAHLDACRRCGLEAATYRTLLARLDRFGTPPPPDAVARLEQFVDELGDGTDPA